MMKRFKFSILGLAIFLLLFTLTACAQKLAAEFDESTVAQSAAQVLDLVNSNDSEAFLAGCTVAMQQALTADVLEQIYAAVAEAGDFREILDLKMYGSRDKSSGEEFAVAIVTAQYEHKRLIYTVSFTKQMKLAGFYYR